MLPSLIRRRVHALNASLAACLVALPALAAENKPAVSGTTETVQIEEVEVTGTLVKQGSAEAGYRVTAARVGPLGCQNLQDTPYSINVTSSDLIKNTQAMTIQKAVQYNPTVAATSPMNLVGGGASFAIRGFTDTDKTIDGMRAPSLANLPVEDKEAIEVMNGPTSFLFGVGSPGGTLNFVLKRPTYSPLATLTMGITGGEQMYWKGDFGGPLDRQGKFAYRLNLLYVNAGELAINDLSNPRNMESVALDWNYAPEGRMTFDYSHYETKVDHGADLFSVQLGSVKKGKITYAGLTELPSVPDATANYMPAFSRAGDFSDRVGTGITQKLDDHFTLRSNFAYTTWERNRHRAADLLLDDAGDYWLTRNYYDQNSTTYQGNVFLDGTFETGFLAHKVTLGVVDDYTEVKYAYPYKNQNINYGLYNLYNGTPYATDVAGDAVGNPNKTTQEINNSSFIFADTVTITDQWSVMLGGNYAEIQDKTWTYNSPTVVTDNPVNEKGAFTPGAALMYKPTSNVTTYLSYIEGLQEGGTAPSTAANANEVLAPYISRQVELGVKTQLCERISLTTALYHITKPYAFTDPTDNVYKSAGQETHNGIEFTATGKVTHDLTLNGGFSLLDATVEGVGSTKVTGAGGKKVALEGVIPAGVPRQIGRLFAEYAIPCVSGLFVNAGALYTGAAYVDAGNTLEVPWSMTGNVGLRYETRIYGHAMTTRFNVENFTGEDYWVATGSGLALGQPRTYSLSFEFAWF